MKEVYLMVGLPKMVLNIVVLCWDAQLNELVFECAALLKEAMHFAFYFH